MTSHGSSHPREPNDPRDRHDPLDEYHRISDTVGGVPSLRLRDNVIQTIVVDLGAIVGALAGWAASRGGDWNFPDHVGVMIGGVIGLIASAFGCGLVLMVLGWRREYRRRRSRKAQADGPVTPPPRG